jgi:hypothetical protein
MMDGSIFNHDQSGAALSPGYIVVDETLAGHALVIGQKATHRRHSDSILQLHAVNNDRRKQTFEISSLHLYASLSDLASSLSIGVALIRLKRRLLYIMIDIETMIAAMLTQQAVGMPAMVQGSMRSHSRLKRMVE